MIFVHVMEMGIMQVVDMAFMAYCRMPTIGTVLVRMIGMMILIASGHCDFPFFLAGRRRLRRFGSMIDGASTKRSRFQASPLACLASNRSRAEPPRAWNIADACSKSARLGSFGHNLAG
jgi:hypothetical protein